MKPERRRSGARALHQRGFALIAMLVLAAMITAYLVAIGLNRSKAEILNEQEDHDMKALRQAKAALIAYAASEQWQRYKGQAPDQPGGLPCPDLTNSGSSFGVCSGASAAAAAQRVGRLPYLTIGSEDLRDASGERLWYAVSSTFYKGNNIINSDTQGSLTVTGAAPARNVVAIVFAPGPPVQDSFVPGQVQDRSGAKVNRTASYLEGYAPTGPDHSFASSALPTSTFNDRLLVITQADLMAAVEPVVAARIERDVVPVIKDYYSGWHVYPFPVPFNPGLAQPAYQGDKNQTRGLLPITPGPNWVEWDPSSVAVTQIAGGTCSDAPCPPPYNISPFPPDCSASTKTQISCDIYYTGTGNPGDRPAIQIQATLRKAGLAFPAPMKVQDAVMTDLFGNPVAGGNYGQWSWTPWLPSGFVPTANGTVLSNGDATVAFQGRLVNPAAPPVGTGGKVTITIGFTYMFNDPTRPNVDWFIQNEWFRQAYYAVSQGFLAGGGNACNPPPGPAPVCLTVNNLRPSYASSKDKQAIVLLAGRSLSGSPPRPSTTLADYFENANLFAANGATLVYENRSGAPTAINDRVVVVSP